MSVVTLAEAQVKLSELVERLTPGEEVVITKDGQPVAKLVATPPRTPRRAGSGKGQIVIHSDDDAYSADFAEYM